ncbi:MAG: TIR domain-containing protein [Maribacter sp.]
MANPRAFISFDFDNNSKQRLYFVGQSKNIKTPFNIEDWSSKSALPQAQWEALIKAKINKCHFLIVLVGLKTSTAVGVRKEIAFAKEQNVPVFGVYVDGANTTTLLPIGLQRNRTIKWTWDGISAAVDQMMLEGKNKIR